MSKLSKPVRWLTIKEVSELQECSIKTVRRKLSGLMSKLDKKMSNQIPNLSKRENNKILVNSVVVDCDFDLEQLQQLKIVQKIPKKELLGQSVESINSLESKIAILSNEKKYLIDKVDYLKKDCEELKKELIEVNQERRKEAEQFRILLMKEKELQILAPQIDSKSKTNLDLYGVLLVVFVVGMLLILGVLALIGW